MDGTRSYVTIVSGLPRSGTSLMMRMLETGGIEVLSDGLRDANEDNPNGYYEYEPVKALAEDKAWVPAAMGRAVKVIYKLVYELPADLPYRILFMQRDLEEVLRSQETMMRRDGLDPDAIGRDVLLRLFQTDVLNFEGWAAAQPNIAMLRVGYRDLVERPRDTLRAVDGFLGGGLDIDAMAGVADGRLYRNRAPA